MICDQLQSSGFHGFVINQFQTTSIRCIADTFSQFDFCNESWKEKRSIPLHFQLYSWSPCHPSIWTSAASQLLEVGKGAVTNGVKEPRPRTVGMLRIETFGMLIFVQNLPLHCLSSLITVISYNDGIRVFVCLSKVVTHI